MVIQCQILINRPRTGVYYPGQIVTGTVKYVIEEPTEFKDIVLSLFGKGKCHWKETQRINNISTAVPYTGTEEYFDFRRSLVDKKDKTILLDAGCYEEKFDFLLPDNLPSTYKDRYCNIMYCVKLTFYKKGYFTSDKTYTTQINVQGHVSVDNENALTFGLEKKIMKLFSSKNNVIKVKGLIDRRVLTPGQEANLIFEVTNETDIIIPKLKTELVAYKVYTADCGRKKRKMNIIKECSVASPCIPDNGVANLSNTIKVLDNLYSLQNTKVFELEYKLKVTVKLPRPYFNASVEAPVVIGHKCNSKHMELVGDEPPSYWESMLEVDNDSEFEKGETTKNL